MPVINKPTRLIKNTAATIDHIFINSVTTTKFKARILKSDVDCNIVTGCNIHIKETKERFIFRRDLPDISVEKFKYKRTYSSDTTKVYDNFIENFSSLYDECFFPKKEN